MQLKDRILAGTRTLHQRIAGSSAKDMPGTTSCPQAEFVSHAPENIKPCSWSTMVLAYNSLFLLVSRKLILIFLSKASSPLWLTPGPSLPARLRFDPTTGDLRGQLGIELLRDLKVGNGKSFFLTFFSPNGWSIPYHSGSNHHYEGSPMELPPAIAPTSGLPALVAAHGREHICLHVCSWPAQLPTDFMSQAFCFPPFCIWDFRSLLQNPSTVPEPCMSCMF